jgi:PII-like signaling protein
MIARPTRWAGGIGRLAVDFTKPLGGVITMNKRMSDSCDSMEVNQEAVRLRIYLGEDKRHEDLPLYRAIVAKARRLRLAGATVVHGTEGFGHSTRLHTVDVLFSADLPVVIEIIDRAQKVDELVSALDHVGDIGLITYERVTVLRC